MRQGISSMHLRRAQATDVSALADLLVQSFHGPTSPSSWFYRLLRIGIHEDLRHRLGRQSNSYICWVAEVMSVADTARALAGTIEMDLRYQVPWSFLTESSSKFPQDWCYLYLSNLAVPHSRRRQGVATQLLQACEQTARAWGYRQIYLHVLENNQAARQLYFRAGYQFQQIDNSLVDRLLNRPRRLLLRKVL